MVNNRDRVRVNVDSIIHPSNTSPKVAVKSAGRFDRKKRILTGARCVF